MTNESSTVKGYKVVKDIIHHQVRRSGSSIKFDTEEPYWSDQTRELPVNAREFDKQPCVGNLKYETEFLMKKKTRNDTFHLSTDSHGKYDFQWQSTGI